MCGIANHIFRVHLVFVLGSLQENTNGSANAMEEEKMAGSVALTNPCLTLCWYPLT